MRQSQLRANFAARLIFHGTKPRTARKMAVAKYPQYPRQEPAHGTNSRYSGGKYNCRCYLCRAAHRLYRRADREALYRAGLTSEGKMPVDTVSRGRGAERFLAGLTQS